MNEPTMKDFSTAARWLEKVFGASRMQVEEVESLAFLVADVRAAERERCAKVLDASDGLAAGEYARRLRALTAGADDPMPPPRRPTSAQSPGDSNGRR